MLQRFFGVAPSRAGSRRGRFVAFAASTARPRRLARLVRKARPRLARARAVGWAACEWARVARRREPGALGLQPIDFRPRALADARGRGIAALLAAANTLVAGPARHCGCGGRPRGGARRAPGAAPRLRRAPACATSARGRGGRSQAASRADHGDGDPRARAPSSSAIGATLEATAAAAPALVLCRGCSRLRRDHAAHAVPATRCAPSPLTSCFARAARLRVSATTRCCISQADACAAHDSSS
jgi:hypothetical protein